MLAKLGFVIALTLTASSAAIAVDPLTGRNAAEPPAHERCAFASEPQASAPQGAILLPPPDPAGDITNARGPNAHHGLLTQYAVYASIGNRDGMQIISDQLRKFGVTREELEDYVDHAKVHTRSSREPERIVSEAEQPWKLSQ
jgi:hypothetical protein